MFIQKNINIPAVFIYNHSIVTKSSSPLIHRPQEYYIATAY